ncbi:MAG: peptide chain release factor 2 [Firmicutes bacterium]|nr:peptide chain release factor 2 [Bacillota bacterium]HBG08417.1 peptide chain release factor 2 [Bacillota bacterium]
MFDIAGKQERLGDLEGSMLEAGFWDNQELAQQTTREVSELKRIIKRWQNVHELYEDVQVLLELVEESEDQDLQGELTGSLERLEREVDRLELESLLSGEYDASNAILTIHPGAGGTESQDWASMLWRMYTRWAEDQGYGVEVLDHQPGDEAGIKDVTLLIKGLHAYGYLKSEKGVHRLVRISPFDSSGRRHTSFSSVEVLPEIEDDVSVEINPDDLRIDTYRSSGAGGQHVNKTDSAVRITHLPTGIVVQCQSERSQHANRESALKILRARLMERQLAEQRAKLESIKGEQQEIAWGSQIRSYVFCPYTMVKDHRTNVEVGNVEAVMDGYLDPFIEAYLKMKR